MQPPARRIPKTANAIDRHGCECVSATPQSLLKKAAIDARGIPRMMERGRQASGLRLQASGIPQAVGLPSDNSILDLGPWTLSQSAIRNQSSPLTRRLRRHPLPRGERGKKWRRRPTCGPWTLLQSAIRNGRSAIVRADCRDSGSSPKALQRLSAFDVFLSAYVSAYGVFCLQF
jgi:hypothetical protein